MITKAESVRKWRKKYPADYYTYKIAWFERHAADMPEEKRKKRCRFLRVYATRYGLITRPDHCERCYKECKPNAHHFSYLQVLDVQWLCRDCHNEADKEREQQLGIVRAKPVRRGREHYRKVYERAMELWATGHWSQVAIAKLLSVNNSAVSKWVNGINRPR